MTIAKILEAAAFAADKHRGQRRKDAAGTPYINHPLAVARILASEGGIEYEDVLCAALLHDTIEDTDTTFNELHFAFGFRVAWIVVEVTDDKMLPKAVRKRQQVLRAADLSYGAKLVKLADKIANLRGILNAPPLWSDERKAEYFDWAAAVAVGLRGTNASLERALDAELAKKPQ